jgi:hypothetical protein
MAFVITWQEWERHQIERKRLWRESGQAAIVTFFFFLALSVLFGFIVTKYVLK